MAGGPTSAAGALAEADKRAAGLGGTLKRIGEVAAGVLLADALQRGAQKARQMISEAVKAASDLGESVNAVNKVFGDASEQVQQWGKDNANAIGLSTRAFNQAATPLGSMLKNQGLQLDQVTEHTIKLTERAADMASVFNTDVGDALVAIQAGLRGEQDPLERYGVSISAVAVEARALADSHKTSVGQLTAQEKALARLNIIYDQTADTAGDFRDTADGLANAQRISTAQIEEAKAKIGQTFIPVMAKAAQVTGQFAEIITSLPQPVVVLTAAVLGLGAAAALLAPRIVATHEALEKMSTSDSRLQRGLARTAVIVGKATVAFAALQAAAVVTGAVIGDGLNPQVEAATKGLSEYAEKGKLAGESARLFGEDADKLSQAIHDLTVTPDAIKGFLRLEETLTGTGGIDDSVHSVEERIRTFDAALASMVQNGHAAEAGDLVLEMATKAKVSVAELRDLLPTYSAAVEVGADKTEALGNAAGNASRQLKELTESATSHIAVVFSLEEAQDKAADAIQQLRDQIKKQREEHDKNATALIGNSQTARDNRAAVRDLVDTYQELITKTAEAGKSTDGMDKQLEDSLVQMDFNRTEAHKYVKELSLIPDEVTTQVKLDATQALQKAQETARELHRMLAGATTVTVSARDPMSGGHAHGGITGAESGGVRGGFTMVGERGRELVKLPFGSTVIPNGTTESMMSGGGGGGATIHLHLHVNGREVRDWLRDDAVKRNVSSSEIRVAYP